MAVVNYWISFAASVPGFFFLVHENVWCEGYDGDCLVGTKMANRRTTDDERTA